MGGVHEGSAAARHHVLDGAAVDLHRVALVVVDVAAYGREVAVVRVADEVVDGAAAFDGARVVFAVHVQGRAGDEDLGERSLDTSRSHAPCSASMVPSSPVSMPMIRTGPASMAQYGPGWTACWAGEERNLRASVRCCPSAGCGRCHSSDRSQARERARRGLRGEWRGVVAEDAHEAAEVFVPVVVAGYRVYGCLVVLVRAEELRAVVVRPADWVDHVAGDDGEFRS